MTAFERPNLLRSHGECCSNARAGAKFSANSSRQPHWFRLLAGKRSISVHEPGP